MWVCLTDLFYVSFLLSFDFVSKLLHIFYPQIFAAQHLPKKISLVSGEHLLQIFISSSGFRFPSRIRVVCRRHRLQNIKFFLYASEGEKKNSDLGNFQFVL